MVLQLTVRVRCGTHYVCVDPGGFPTGVKSGLPRVTGPWAAALGVGLVQTCIPTRTRAPLPEALGPDVVGIWNCSPLVTGDLGTKSR